MNQLNLFDHNNNIDLDPEPNMSKKKASKTTESIESIRAKLEAIPVFPKGKTYSYMEQTFLNHKKEGRDGFARAIASEWVVR